MGHDNPGPDVYALRESGVGTNRAKWKMGFMREHQNTPFLAATNASGSAGSPAETPPDERSAEVIVDTLASVLVTLERLIADRSADELRQAAHDGGWGAVELLAHMQDWEEITHERVWRILEEDRPELQEYDDSLWAIEHDYGNQDAHQVFGHIAELRQDLIERLRGLDDSEWQREAFLSTDGDVTLMWLMSNLNRQDENHLAEVREALG